MVESNKTNFEASSKMMPFESEKQIDSIILGLKALYSKLAS